MRLRIFSIVLILVVGMISILGFSGVSTMDHEGAHRCPISFVLVGDCPPTLGGWAFVSHHVSGFQYAMRSILATQVDTLLLSILFAPGLFLVSSALFWAAILHLFVHQRYRPGASLSLTPPHQLLRWFALRNRKTSRPSYCGVHALT